MAKNAPGAAGADDGPPLSELESLQLNINNTTDESLESTRRMKQMCEEAKDSGIKTLVRLASDGFPYIFWDNSSITRSTCQPMYHYLQFAANIDKKKGQKKEKPLQ